jgi:5-methylcytosine-specific restriction endonuclease McrA
MKCECCGYSWKENIEAARAGRIASLRQTIKTWEGLNWKTPVWIPLRIKQLESGDITEDLVDWGKRNISGDRRPEIDHIIPVALGGTTLGFENLQLLCNACHKTKTKEDMVEIRASRRTSEAK